MQKSFATNLAAIGSQAKKRENGAFQEIPPVRRSHIPTMTLRAWSRWPHKTDSYLVPSEEKVQEKWVIAWVSNQAERTLINRSRAIARGPDQSHSTICRVSIMGPVLRAKLHVSSGGDRRYSQKRRKREYTGSKHLPTVG